MIYAMSDIHGDISNLTKNLLYLRHLSGGEKLLKDDDILIFLGDYIDRGPGGKQVLETVKKLQEKYPNQVFALMGNHDEMFINWLKTKGPLHLCNDRGMKTILSFWNWDTFPRVDEGISTNNQAIFGDGMKDITNDIIGAIWQNNKELLGWYQSLPYWMEIDGKLFVHAGFDEDGRHWSESDKETMTWQYPAQKGFTPWNKMVVAGHICTAELNSDGSNNIYISDNHVYIDGGAPFSGRVTLAAFDESYIYDKTPEGIA